MFHAAERRKLMEAIGGDPDAPARAYTWSEYGEYYRYLYGPKFVRTFSGAVAGVVLLLGGWLTTVDAASKSLPGDPLYGLKIITEQAQLRIASLEQRAVLHTEFAERRLNEAVALQQEDDASPAVVRQAMQAFKEEVVSASADLQELQQNANTNTVATATVVEEKLDQLDTVLDKAVAAADAEISTDVQEAKDVSREVQSSAVSVIVDDHEAQETDRSQRELKELFLRDFGDIQARQSFDLHRIEVVRNAMRIHAAKLEGVDLPSEDELAEFDRLVGDIDDQLSEAMNAFAIGAFRQAFDTLHELDSDLLAFEAELAGVEVAITTTLTTPVEETTTETAQP